MVVVNILFICLGNICRSPMAEFVFKDMAKKLGKADEFYVSSSATSYEEIGNGVHRGTRAKLAQHGISTEGKYAVRMTKEDYENYDYIIGMDSMNIRNILRITDGDSQGKVRTLLSFAGVDRDIADPWYTGDFDKTYQDVVTGCEALLTHIKEKQL